VISLESPSRLRVTLWLATAAASGALIMALEILSFRLYAPYLGNSIYVWGTMISVVMLALAAGYAVGGWVADRSHTDLPLYGFIFLSALYQLAICLVGRFVLAWVARFGEFGGAALATLVIFVLPMTTLAAVSPFVVRLLARGGHVGQTAGVVYALSTVGSIAGVLATTFVLVPRVGSQATLRILCATSALVAVVGLARRRRLALLGLLPFATLLFLPEARWPANTVAVSESAYNLVRVVRSGPRVVLLLNAEGSVHTIRNEAFGWAGSYHDDFALGPLLVEGRRLLVLGMGGGGSIISTRAVAPDIETDAVEIDREVVEAARRFFGLAPDPRRLRVHVADARPWLSRHRGMHELIHVDLYHGGPYVPFYLVTVEFFELVRARMAAEGVLLMNVFDAGPGRELLLSIGATLRCVFPTVALLSRETGSHLLLAFAERRSIDGVRERLRSVEGSAVVRQLAQRAARALVEFEPPPGVPIFTDDHAPVEELTRSMMEPHWARLVGSPAATP
jgi:predicted membrane-bound spermidine synthase